MKKITALFLAAAFLLVLAGCETKPKSGFGEVNVYNWGDYISEGIIEDFQDKTGITVHLLNFETNEQLYSVLRQGGSDFDVIIPSDYMIDRLIDEDMLEKLDFKNIPNYALIDPELKNLEFDPTGEYSVPYLWGTVGIICNSSMIDAEITSWEALFNPAYAGQILMFDNSRDAMGIALKLLGFSYNTTDPAELEAAFTMLRIQKPLLQGYVMDQIFDKLEAGEAAIGPYYAGDYITMSEANPDLRFVIPAEGTNRFVDSMCIPKGARNKANAEAFINFMCSTEPSLMNAEEIGYTSPNIEVRALLNLSAEAEAITYPSEEILSRCEVFTNLPQDILDLYDDYWVRLKS